MTNELQTELRLSGYTGGFELSQLIMSLGRLFYFAAPDYKWPTYDLAPEEHLQALGAISLNFNLYESGFRAFLNHYMPDDLAELLFDKLNTNKRQKLLLELIASREADPNVKEHTDFLIKHSPLALQTGIYCYTPECEEPNPRTFFIGEK
jgi:hypothetical protein